MILKFLSSSLPCFLAGVIVTEQFAGRPIAVVVSISCAASLCLLLVLRSLLPRLTVWRGLALLSGALGVIHGWQPRPLKLPDVDGAFVTLEGRLEAVRVLPRSATGRGRIEPERMWTMAAVTDDGGLAFDRRVEIRLDHDHDLEIGERLRVFGWLQLEAGRWRLKGRVRRRLTMTSSPAGWGLRWRRRVRRGYDRRLQGFPRRVLGALVLGRNELRIDEKRLIRRAGVAHLFAVSGLHLVLVGALAGFALRRLRVRDPYLTCATFLCALGFAVLSGLRPPMTRALGCLLLYSWARLARRPMQATWGLLVVAVFEILRDPALVASLSFQLSFTAVLGILWLGPPPRDEADKQPLRAFLLRKKKTGAWRELRRGLQLTSAALIATAPLTLFHFGTLAPIALATSLAFMPLVGILLGLGLIDLLIPLPVGLFESLCDILSRALRGAGNVDWGYWEAGRPPTWALFPYFVLILVALGMRRRAAWISQLLAWTGVVVLVVAALPSTESLRLVHLHRPEQFAFRTDSPNSTLRSQPLEMTEGEQKELIAPGIRVLGQDRGRSNAWGECLGLSFLHCGAMTPEEVVRFCQTERNGAELVILPAAGASTESTALLLHHLRPRLVVCARAHSESFMLALRSGCEVIDAPEFNRRIRQGD